MIEMDDRDIRRAMSLLSKALNADDVGKKIKRETSKQLRGLVDPMLQRRKAAILRVSSHGHKGPSMRQAIAKQTKAQARWSGKQGGVSIIQRARAMPRNFNMAGRAFNRAAGWNPQPIGGVKHHQQIRPVAWFDSESDAGETRRVRREIERALESTAGRIASEIHHI